MIHNDTLDTLADVDAAHDEYARFVPTYLIAGIESDVAHEDEDYIAEIEADHEMVANVAYAVRMAL